VNFPVLEYWIDIGAPHDYLQAQEDAKRMGGGS
jgi:NDP-sugar pyrophosphorylase family protein